MMSSAIKNRLLRYRFPILLICLLVLGGVAVLASTPERDLTWSASSLAPTVVAGGATVTTTFSFTDTGKLPLPNAEVQLSPSLAGLVSVSPTRLGTVKQGETVTLTLTASAPASSTPSVVHGSIQLQKDNPRHDVYGLPLQIDLNITWPKFTDPALSYSVAYPPKFTATLDSYHELLLRPQSLDPEVEDVPGVVISEEPNPQSLSVEQFFDGTYGPDLIGQSLGIFSTSTLPSGATAYRFDPVVTLAGGLIFVIPRPHEFVVVQGQGVSAATLQTILDSLVLG